ncbi:phosphopantetheine-binding protein [Lentzea kentuckyensis]|uniref:phosphopantetheine-binding protein n=1 Tax=Lentzea kentuckyensis TaxID=360086 RepID=UPI000A3BDDFA|nr:phosphopantetheine-binding protein [Lentzea kentuckyensis]
MSATLTGLDTFVITQIEEEMGVSGVTLASKLDEIDMDSLTFSEVLMSVEKEFGVDLEELLETFVLDANSTVGGLVESITAKLS